VGAPKHYVELVELDGFVEEIVGADFDRPERVLALALAGDDDDLGLGWNRGISSRGEILLDAVRGPT
jgi:hypothetical protein